MIFTEIINQALCIPFAQSHMKFSYKLINFLLVMYKVSEQSNFSPMHLGGIINDCLHEECINTVTNREISTRF